jgi:class 3 adenylate cyclase
MREERKLVTALFADLVGSTALGEQLDAEDVKVVVGDAVARIVTEIERVGGHVKDLAGDGVLAYFGAPVSYEDDAERALLAGLAIVRELDEYGAEIARAWGIEGFGVRVGVATGPVVLGRVGGGGRVEYGGYGDTVNTAARLEAAAAPGTVLVDSATRALVAPLFDWGEPAGLVVKGKSAPVEAWQARAALPAARARQLDAEQAPLVGRERELDVGGPPSRTCSPDEAECWWSRARPGSARAASWPSCGRCIAPPSSTA